LLADVPTVNEKERRKNEGKKARKRKRKKKREIEKIERKGERKIITRNCAALSSVPSTFLELFAISSERFLHKILYDLFTDK
jgi:hypothetical protein